MKCQTPRSPRQNGIVTAVSLGTVHSKSDHDNPENINNHDVLSQDEDLETDGTSLQNRLALVLEIFTE